MDTTARAKFNKFGKGQRHRMLYRASGFLLIVGIYSVFHFVASKNNMSTQSTRRLQALESVALNMGNVETGIDVKMFGLVVLGVLYMFVAIAILCDEFFVPALEEIASENYLNLSMDVAGATLMAAGGSAPELCTSLIGTFQKSEVGFGTIVGSAVFNVLFVIGMCAIFSKDVLELTWWPLFRDCTYYALVLSVLAFFCGVSSPNEIEVWEASILFALYIGYVVFMKFNEKVHSMIVKRASNNKIADENNFIKDSRLGNGKSNTFRIGLLNLFTGKGSVVDKVGVVMVTKIAGDVDAVFKTLDVSGDGFIDTEEFKQLIEVLGTTATDDETHQALVELDDNKDGKEFTKWYIKSEIRLKKELRKTFDEFDVDKSGTIDGKELRKLMKELGTEVMEEDVEATLVEAHITGPSDQISFEEFQSWYTQSRHWGRRMSIVDSCVEQITELTADHLKPPKDGKWFDYVCWLFLLPIIALLCFTIPDVRQPGKSRLCFVAFLLSILWIGAFTFFMVEGAEIIGNALGIPIVLMGLTILAAGTSVPDLLSSVIVARMGEGDMAVSSSIGSNIFDITVGLPIPWLLFYAIYPEDKVVVSDMSNEDSLNFFRTTNFCFANQIETKGMTRSILILLVMLVCIVLMIHYSGWKMTKALGGGMFVLYFAYLAQAIIFGIRER
eukprot:scaffold1137_cov247-Chaetoceros_neogracile.AAC.16